MRCVHRRCEPEARIARAAVEALTNVKGRTTSSSTTFHATKPAQHYSERFARETQA